MQKGRPSPPIAASQNKGQMLLGYATGLVLLTAWASIAALVIGIIIPR